MTPGISFEELLAWNNEVAELWRIHFEANPAQLELACGIANNAKVIGLVRHIWGVELLWSQRLSGIPATDRNSWPHEPLQAIFDLHTKASENFARLFSSDARWDEPTEMDFKWLPEGLHQPTLRKLCTHALLHSHRHWAQATTLLRNAGYTTGIGGDFIFSRAIR